ncbi:lysosomal proton-coupled steroid conjugate and bile acid symporter SLC46A3-like isoform X2 [Ptychodera flava]|uniref:lysosomal proton-coupled steroid conjugate and bile acid symporter SLC46A3-like isoform X2 n=1 Tax=Ptychodera flava TaxID=63121 RepID=UPI00396A9C9D
MDEYNDKDETAPLISKPATGTSDQRKSRYVTVEPMIFLFIFGRATYMLAFPQFIKERLASDQNVSAFDRSNGSCYLNKSSKMYVTQEEIQKQATLWTMYLNATAQCLAMITATILCSYSDHGGRKLPAILPPVGALLNALVYLVVINFHLPLHFLFIGAILQGVAGEHTTELAACFSYLADITDGEKRRFRFAVVDVTFYLGTAGAQVLTGYLIQILGYEAPFWIMFGCMFVVFFYAVLFLQESLQRSDTTSVSWTTILVSLFKNIWRLFKSDIGGRRSELIRGNIVLLLQFSAQSTATSLYVLYLLDVPFCWTPVFIGYFNAIRVCLRAPGILIGGKLLPFCLSELAIVQLSLLSFISSFVLSAFAYNDVMMFVVPIIASLASLTLPLIRARISRLVDPNEQGDHNLTKVYYLHALVAWKVWLTSSLQLHLMLSMPQLWYISQDLHSFAWQQH